MADYITCLGLGSFSAEDRAELQGFIASAGSEAGGVRAYMASLDADMAELRGQVAAKLGVVGKVYDQALDQPLYVVHNLSEQKLRYAAELGGLAAPSLAIARGDIGFDNFGEISLIGDPSMADPKGKGVRAFNADVYSPRQPRASFKVNAKDRNAMVAQLQPFGDKLGVNLQNYLDDRTIEKDGLAGIEAQTAAKMAYLAQNGVTVDPVLRAPQFAPEPVTEFAGITGTMPYDVVRADGFEAAALEYANNFLARVSPSLKEKTKDVWFSADGTLSDTGRDRIARVVAGRNADIRDFVSKPTVDVDRYETSKAVDAAMIGKETDFSEWVASEFGAVIGGAFFEDGNGRRKDYVLSNIVKEMTKTIRNGEKWNYGAGNVRASSAKEFKSLSEIKDARGNIVPNAEFDVVRDEVNNQLFALMDQAKPYFRNGDSFGFTDTFVDYLMDVAKGPRAMAEWAGTIVGPLPETVTADIAGFLEGLKSLPTEYFEIKMQRAVGLSEFTAALVPENASDTTVKTLTDAGLQVVRYAPNQRQSALAALADRVFFQGQTDKRGSITFPSGGVEAGTSVIDLFENANLSTVIHETGHYWLEVFNAVSSDATASQQMRDDMDVLHKFLGSTKGTAFTVDQHETFARATEAYLMEGKAPSLELADVFAQVKSWLVRIYQTVRGLNVKLTPEVRAVFDRMIASDAEIAQSREAQGMKPMFTTEAAAGMSPASFKIYQRMARRSVEQAEAALLEKTMAKVRREKEAWWKAEKEAFAKEVEPTINSQPAYRLVEMLANKRWLGDAARDIPDIQLNRAELVELFGSGVLAELSRQRLGGARAIYADGGAPIGDVADMFGFVNAQAMVQTLQNTGKRKAVIAAEVDRIMLDRYGDPMTDGSIQEEALAAIHSDQQAKLVAAEVRHLAARAGLPTKNLTAQVFRQRARLMLGRMAVGDAVRTNAFLTAERQAAKRAEDAFARVAAGRDAGEALTAATRFKEQQLLNHYLYMESRDLAKMVDRGRERMRDYNRATVRAKLAGGYIEQIDALLDQYDFRVRGQRQIQRAESLSVFVDRMIADGRGGDLAIDPKLIAQAKRMHYSRMTVDDLRGFFDTVENIDHLGRFKQKLITAKRKRELDASVGVVTDAIAKNFGTDRAGKKSVIRDTFNLLWTMDTMLIEYDGLEEIGPVYDEIKADIDAGAALDQKMQVELAEKMDDLFKVYDAKELAAMQVPKVIDGANGRPWAKVEVLAVALNMGNADNKLRLFEKNAHEKNRLTPGQADALLATLDKRDWEFVQSMWDQVNSFWPQLSEVSERRTGVKPKKVDAVPIVTPHGTFPGGYYPIKYDPELSTSAMADESTAWDKFLSNGWGAKAEVKSGMTKERAASGGGRTLRLDLMPAFAHMKDTIRLIALSEAVDASYKILNDRRVKQAFLDAGRVSDLDVMNLWLKDVAQGPVQNNDVINRFARIVKNNFTLSRLAFNMKTVALQATGLGQSAAVIGKKNMLMGMMDYRKRPRQLAAEVIGKSAFMAERQTSMNKDIYDFANDVELSSPLASRYKKAKTQLAKAGFAPMTMMQFYSVDMPTWLGAYRSSLEKGSDDAKAILYADRMVARAQDGGLMADRSAVSRGTLSKGIQQADFVRLFTTLGGYMMTKMNRGYITARRAGRDISAAPTMAEKAAAVTSAATDLALLYVFEGAFMALMYSLVYGGDDDEKDKEDYAKFIASQTAMSMIGGLPFVRDAATAFQGYGAGGVLGSVLELPANLYVQSMQGENDRALRRSVADLVGTTTGLPTTAAMRAIEEGLSSDGTMAEALFGQNPIGR